MTKRRKVWVVFDEDWKPLWPERKKAAAVWLSINERRDGEKLYVAQFIERRPGDVVLSREDRAKVSRLLRSADAAARLGLAAEAQMLNAQIAALLRGGR